MKPSPHKQEESPATKVAREYCERFTTLPSRTLARTMRKERPVMFRNVEHARHFVRLVRGRHGDEKRKRTRRDLFLPAPTADKPALPQSVKVEWLPYILPRDLTPLLALGDLHAPFHDESAIERAVTHGKREGCAGVLLAGDVWDCYEFSKFNKNPEERDPLREMAVTRQLLEYLRAEFPTGPIIWKEGNHEERYALHVNAENEATIQYMTATGRKLDDSVLSVPGLLQTQNLGIQWICDQRPIRVRALTILHGNEYRAAMPVNPARTAFLKLSACALVFHSHQSSTHSGKSILDVDTVTWSAGCLCQLRPRYARVNNWNHGFAIVAQGEDGFTVKNYRIGPKGEVWT